MGKYIDLTGQIFGRYTVIESTGKNTRGESLWLCECSCGNEKVIVGSSLKNGHTKSCGCLQKELVREFNLIDLTDQVFGRLTVLEDVGKDKWRDTLWLCKCSCGKEKVVSGSNLRSGNTKSCGCLQKELASETLKGKHPSEETRKKMSVAQKGENHPNWNPDRQQVKFNKDIRIAMHNLLRHTLERTGGTKTTHSEKMLGYTREDLVTCLESKFLPGMSWDNRGNSVGGWHIDHIKPVSLFVKEGVTDHKIISALSNLQPLWAEDNLRKSNKYCEVIINE
jgi:hypothetical protein